MKTPALLLIGALLAPSAWAEDAGFDLHSAAIRKIVQNTVATQSAIVQLPEKKPVTRAPALELETARITETPALRSAASRPVVAPRRDTFVSALVETLVDSAVDSALGADRHLESQKAGQWLSCQPRGDLNTTTDAREKCPGLNSAE